MQKIDFVITWVDGNDEKWLSEKEKYAKQCGKNFDKRNVRYRDMGILKYWFRAVEKYANWVNKIYFVTCGQIPTWLNTENDKIVVINHEDFIPKKFLPTFNSNAIEPFFNHIENLSEYFVYFNDDMFINDYVKPNDFFKRDLPCDSMSLKAIKYKTHDNFHRKLINDMEIINKHFSFSQAFKQNKWKYLSLRQGKYLFRTLPLLSYNSFIGFRDHHLPISYLKSTFDEVWEKEKDILEKTASFKFRNNEESVNHWLFEYWQFASGKFIQRNCNFGKTVDIYSKGIEKFIKKSKYKVICINDSIFGDNYEKQKMIITNCFEKKYPEKSFFEK